MFIKRTIINDIRQGKNKLLKDYPGYFNQTTLEIRDHHKVVVVHSILIGLQLWDFSKSSLKKPEDNLVDLLVLTKFIYIKKNKADKKTSKMKHCGDRSDWKD